MWNMVQIEQLIDDAKCYQVIRELRWPNGVDCPACGSQQIQKRGHHDRYAYRQRYVCHGCGRQFDDLTGTILEGHRRPLKLWVICLYLMGLNLSNTQIAAELDLPVNEAQAMTSQLREGIVQKKSPRD
jgi:transposase-like protein